MFSWNLTMPLNKCNVGKQCLQNIRERIARCVDVLIWLTHHTSPTRFPRKRPTDFSSTYNERPSGSHLVPSIGSPSETNLPGCQGETDVADPPSFLAVWYNALTRVKVYQLIHLSLVSRCISWSIPPWCQDVSDNPSFPGVKMFQLIYPSLVSRCISWSIPPGCQGVTADKDDVTSFPRVNL